MRSLRRAWSRQPTAVRALGLVVAAVIALNALALILNGGGDESTSGPVSSSFTTGPRGAAAYASLLQRFGHPVERSRERIEDLDSTDGSTVIVLSPDVLVRDEAEALRRFAERGGTVVVGGFATTNLDVLASHPPKGRVAGIPVARATGAGPEVEGVAQVLTADRGSWRPSGRASPLLGAGERTLLAAAPEGSGRILFLADPSPLQNRLLASADNALLGLRLAGAERSPVTFVESVHGFGTARGISALPGEWAIALAGLLLAALVLVAARVRRLGPPEEPEIEMPPARAGYVDAMGLALARRGDSAAIAERLRSVAVSRLSRRTRVQPGSDAASIERAALASGLTPEEAGALAGSRKGEDELMLVAEGLASLIAREDRG